ncbi:UNVERIFIED_CONTAM: hypothetical protein Sangu_2348600 [Sesamum angustifolium]|uniref:MULE transposase domain-containing protein n=1 Tax=Sesamum angustifolium TaxID=2727405 RepID=A0AAW2KVY2_9LAMI
MTGYVSIDIFVQVEKIRETVVPDDPAVSEWGTYMSMLTQELSSVPVVTQSMGRFGINDDYPGPSSYASPSDYAGPSSFAGPSDYAGPSSFAGPSDYAGTSSPAGLSVSSEQDDEPEADSMLNNEHVDSEPDEVEVEGLTTNNPENNDEVSIEVMIDVLRNTASGPRSQRQDHFDLNMHVSCEPTNLYSIIPFFEAMHPEVPADSIDIPTGAWGNFYDSNTGELAIGMVFKSKDHLKASVQDFSVRFARREYRVVESKPKLWKVACKYDQQTGCSWMLRGIFQPNMGLFKITKYAGPHTCLMNEISVEHGNLGKSMIAAHLLGMVRQDPAYDIKFVQQNVKDRFGFEISYHKVWQSLKAAREQIYGTWESSIKKLPRFMAFLQKLNPGTVVEWLNLETDRPGVQMLHYVFWASRPCIEGFRSCRNVISVDGTHLYTKYKHKLLVAVTLDANQQVLPLAFALVDEESLASWRWFLQMLAKHLLPNDDDQVCLISDRHSGLISAINYVPAFKFPRGVHQFCLRHVCSNFNKKFNNIRLKDLCWRAGAEVNARKFERIMTEIRELNEEAYNWLGMIDKTQWTLSHDSGWRTGILTTNMSECVNGVLKGARRLPIVAIVQITFHRSVRYFLERKTRCHRMLNANQEWADFAFRIFEARQAEAVHHIVQKFDYNQQSASILTLSLTGQGSQFRDEPPTLIARHSIVQYSLYEMMPNPPRDVPAYRLCVNVFH